MARYFTRIFLRLSLIVLLLWGFIQSCAWMGELTNNGDRYNSYPYYRNSPYNRSNTRYNTSTDNSDAYVDSQSTQYEY